MIIEIKIPSVGESVNEAILAQWYKHDGDLVQKDEPLFAIETDKVTLEIEAEAAGRLAIVVPEGETVAIGTVVGTIDPEAVEAPAAEPETPVEEAAEAAPVPAEPKITAQPEAALPPLPVQESPENLSPSVRRLVAEKGVDVRQISGSGPGGRITKSDVVLYLEGDLGARAPESKEALQVPGAVKRDAARTEGPGEQAVTRKPMSAIRRRIAERLLDAKQNTAMLTTFNEIDMSSVMEIRDRYKDAFQKKYGVSLGFMSFFIKAGVEALKEFPGINAFIEGKDIVYHHYYHIGIAIGGEKGLVVPVIRNAEQLSFAELEKAIVAYIEKIQGNRLDLADLEGGTFTISNGGVYGSLLSTPILNVPQSGILGMHKIEKRPIVVDDEVVIRPMMYVAMSYDHRIVDGREAVTFLKRIKECIENPERMLMEI
jgi:2-oxoglutarate dehydrogenase E2 component (dihydrolipoamide succinyltransferase)